MVYPAQQCKLCVRVCVVNKETRNNKKKRVNISSKLPAMRMQHKGKYHSNCALRATWQFSTPQGQCTLQWIIVVASKPSESLAFWLSENKPVTTENTRSPPALAGCNTAMRGAHFDHCGKTSCLLFHHFRIDLPRRASKTDERLRNLAVNLQFLQFLQ